MENVIENITKKYEMEGVNCPQCGAPFFYPTGELRPIREFEVDKTKKDSGEDWMYLARTGPIEEYVAIFQCTDCGFITDISPPVNILNGQAQCTNFALADK